ncbi:OmpA family protein [Variovorax sp. J2P1-59]|uniref:OmpA family protein n=1 Tax=Variovorax flavidus TaxID=3053501 RepID=UPI00257739DA|nr:OmpA family protein [Variovorax sp. J2P1-59]MDM0078822.1 OmpA family protein [Variovorax sp. J2P1-59]
MRVLASLVIASNACGIAFAFTINRTEWADIHFASNSTVVTAQELQRLRQLVDSVGDSELQAVMVTGHAHSSESEAGALGEQRAAAVRFHLIQLGVSPTRIAIEGKGSTQPDASLSDGQQRRVEVYYMGLPSQPLEGHGFNPMWTWHLDSLPNAKPPRLRERPDQWDTMTPLQFLPSVVDGALRARFLQQYRMVAVRQRDDDLLGALLKLEDPAALSADASSALLASAFGTPFAKAVFETARTQLDANDPRVRSFASRAWCVSAWKMSEIARKEILQKIPIRQILPTLRSPEQQAWTICAAERASGEDLQFLRSNGVDLNARDGAGRTALHSAVRSFSRSAVKALLAAGADPNIRDGVGRTPLHDIRLASYGPMLPPPDRKRESGDVARVGRRGRRCIHPQPDWRTSCSLSFEASRPFAFKGPPSSLICNEPIEAFDFTLIAGLRRLVVPLGQFIVATTLDFRRWQSRPCCFNPRLDF